MVESTKNPLTLLFERFKHLTITFKKHGNEFSILLICPMSKEVIKIVTETITSRRRTKIHLAEKLLIDPELV
jgi:hypothetical protein